MKTVKMNNCRKTFPTLCLLAVTFLFSACSSSDDDDLVGNWIRSADFEGVARSNAASFIIDDIVYICGGYDGTNRLNDMWEFNISRGYWTQKAPFPGTERNFASAFSIGQKGYVGLGYTTTDKYKRDFYCYDKATDTWTQIADFGGSGRHSAVSFAIGGKGYVGSGNDGNYLKDFYSYDPSSDTWTQIASIGGTKRQGASSFIMGNDVYVVGGVNNASYVNDFWVYDHTTDTWTEKRKISDVTSESYDDDYNIVRAYGVTFVMGSKAYYTCGESSSILNSTWEYDPYSDLWTEKTGMEGSARTGAVGFALNDRGFVTTGRSQSYRFDDMYEFKPFDEYDEND